jgi:chemotaxis protein methyltransferase CheR
MLNDAEFALIAREIKARSGALMTRDMAGAAEMRLQPLARREGLASVSEVIAAARIRPDGQLWDAIADALAHSETRFFRDREAFARLGREIIPAALARRGHERARIWCAGVSTGQEAYSVAMIIEELRAEGLNPAIEIIATDISERLIDKARTGLYTQFEVQRGLPIQKLIAHFEKAGDLWRIADRLRSAVRFETHNLMKHPEMLGRFDIILLRHVLPAFDPAMRAEVLTRAADALKPDGVIVLGAGEALPEGVEGLIAADGAIMHQRNARAAA